MSGVAAILASPGRKWFGKPPATPTEIAALQDAVKIKLPEEYLELILACNGGEGELALAPLWFQLFDTFYAIEMATDQFYRTDFNGFFFFGSNGGLESIAFDMRGVHPWPIVMVDCIAGIKSAETIAPNIREFIEAIGVAPPDEDS
jgi:hypothetical protein